MQIWKPWLIIARLSGKVTIKNGQLMLFTIPFDEGWTLYADGEEVELKKASDLFMSAKLIPGEHEYVLSFYPNGLSAGIKASCCALFGLILICISMRLIKRREKPAEDSESIEEMKNE